jgi:phenylpropionate dioxygenase-like ring-hydroxylating dioxygenase large terminal subunit
VDQRFADDLDERLAYEGERTGPPTDFPELPDIPLGRYTDPHFYEAEISGVFKKSWLFVGHASEIADEGSFLTVDLPFAPVVVVRDQEGTIRAFLNACRHRGAPVTRDSQGVAKHLVCQFHSWSYDLTGKLVGVPDSRDFVNLKPSERGLAPVRCELWGGFVFINLDPSARPLLEDISSLHDRYAGLMTSDFIPVAKRSWDVKSNWKIVTEAFLEVYHLRTVHKNSGGPMADTRRAVMQIHPNGHSSMFLPYRAAGSGGELLDVFFAPDVGQYPDPHGIYRTANPSFLLYPNLVTPTDITGFFILVFWPLEVGRTRLDMHWYGMPWGDGPRPQGWDLKLAAWDMLMNEDVVNLEPIQRSVTAAAHGGIPLNYQERRIWQFHAELDKQIGPNRIPEDLRIPDLLANLIEK